MVEFGIWLCGGCCMVWLCVFVLVWCVVCGVVVVILCVVVCVLCVVCVS